MGISKGNNTLKDRTYKVLFIATIVLSLFNWVTMYTPKIVNMLLVNEHMASIYPAILLTLLLFIDNFKNKKLKKYKYLLYFFLVYFVAHTIINIHSVVIFRFADYAKYDTLESGPTTAYLFIHKLFSSLSDYSAFALSYIIRSEVNLVREFIFSWLIIYSIALYFFDNLNAEKYVMWGIYGAMIIVSFYGFFEIAHRFGFSWGTKFLEAVDPYLYPVGAVHDGWPPLLPGDQLRNVFAERSFYAYWGCLIIPFLMNEICKGKLLNSIPLIIIVSNLIASTARSATVLLVGELAVFFILELVINWKNIYVYILVGILALSYALGLLILVSDGIVTRADVPSEKTEVLMRDGVEFEIERASLLSGETDSLLNQGQDRYNASTFETLTTFGGRNTARSIVLFTKLKVWLDHPILGVGDELSGHYMLEKINEEGDFRDNLYSWCVIQEETGSLRNSFPGLDEYSQSLAYGGIVGFVVDIGSMLAISLFTLFAFVKYKKEKRIDDCGFAVAVLASISAIFLFGISNSFTTGALYYVVFGLALGVIMRNRIKGERGEE